MTLCHILPERRGWVNMTLTSSSSDNRSTSSSFCWAPQPGSWGPKPSVWSWFSLPWTATRTPTNWPQLTQAVCGTRLYNCLTYTCFLWAPLLHRIQPVKVIPWYLETDAPVSLLTAGSKVNMLHLCANQLQLLNRNDYLKPNCYLYSIRIIVTMLFSVNYLYWIGMLDIICKKKQLKKQLHKNANINRQWTWFPNL